MIVRRTQDIIHGDVAAAVRDRDDGVLIFDLRTRAAELELAPTRVAVLCAWGGRMEVTLQGRRVCVDDDTWLPLPLVPAHVRIRSPREIRAFMLLFRPGMPQDVPTALAAIEDRLREEGEAPALPTAMPFLPHLRMHDRSVTPVLLFIRRHCEVGVEDPHWYEEQSSFLLERMVSQHQQMMSRALAVPARRAQTRREILRRILLATDFIHSNFEKPLMLQDMARAAFLSRHHFLRLFKRIHELTPHEYLQRKRATVAARLLGGSNFCVEEVVKHVGFDSRSTLFRAMRRFHGVTPRECRQGRAAPTFVTARRAAVTEAPSKLDLGGASSHA